MTRRTPGAPAHKIGDVVLVPMRIVALDADRALLHLVTPEGGALPRFALPGSRLHECPIHLGASFLATLDRA